MSTHEHIVKSFDSELQRLYGEIGRMGEIAIAQLDAAVDVLQRRDSRAAERVVANDEAIDALEHEVSHDVDTTPCGPVTPVSPGLPCGPCPP